MEFVPITVGIPTWGRGSRVFGTLGRIRQCEPRPLEVVVFIDGGATTLADQIRSAFPEVRVFCNPNDRVGPGGARHQCILAAGQPIFVSFDDDSWPVDADFFKRVAHLFAANPDAGVIAATIWHRNQPEIARDQALVRKADFTGCGNALRVLAYRETRGYLPRPVPYAMEETDLAIQLFANGRKIFKSGELRIFHDTDLRHHETPEVVSGTIVNVALFAFLHYPLRGWPRGLLQLLNKVADSLKRKRLAGILRGLRTIPRVCWDFREYRAPLPWMLVRQFLRLRKNRNMDQ